MSWSRGLRSRRLVSREAARREEDGSEPCRQRILEDMHRIPGVFALLSLSLFAQRQPFTVEAMMKLVRISEPQLSPDAASVAFTAQTVDLDKNTKPRQIYTVAVSGGTPIPVTSAGNNDRPRWMPDGSRHRVSCRRGRIVADLEHEPGRQPVPNSSPTFPPRRAACWSRPTRNTWFSRAASIPECSVNGAFDNACNKAKIERGIQGQRSIRASTRHCSTGTGPNGSRSGGSICSRWRSTGGPIKDLTPGNHDVPPFSLGGSEDYAISPESNEVCYTMNADPDLATSTNTDLYVVPIARRRIEKDHHQPGGGQRPGLFAGRQVPGVPLAVAAGI